MTEVTERLRAPFPWVGGKSRVAPLVWAAFGDVTKYVEPFAGSLAVLLGRPAGTGRRLETVNDADGYICNWWRAVAAEPIEVARHADWPVNETDLFARHLWLVTEGQRQMLAGLEQDPEWFDVRIAGWWVWGISSWLGSDWCSGEGAWILGADGVTRGDRAGDRAPGVSRKLPRIDSASHGVRAAATPEELTAWLQALAERLRGVQVCCGDWSRICTTGAISRMGNETVGIFLDPPYSHDVRGKDLYRVDHDVAAEVREWAIANGDEVGYRIVLAGYYDEHADAMPEGWRLQRYSAGTFNATHLREGANEENRHKECLWFSPQCMEQTPLARMLGVEAVDVRTTTRRGRSR